MLTLSLKNKKQADNFDRRKKIGTTKASDIWSLGCLFYEIVTGQFLFNSNNWMHFFMQVTSNKQPLLKDENKEKMGNNIYLIDFLKFILIRDPQHRPSIHSIMGRYHNLYQLLVNDSSGVGDRKKSITVGMNHFGNGSQSDRDRKQKRKRNIDELLEDYRRFLDKKTTNLCLVDQVAHKQDHHKGKDQAKVIKIMDDIYYLQCSQLNHSTILEIKGQGITHIIVEDKTPHQRIFQLREFFKVMELQNTDKNNQNQNFLYLLCPKISDILR